MNWNKLFSNIIYIFIWVSIWGLIELTIEHFTNNNLKYKIITYVILLALSISIYTLLLKHELELKAIQTK